MAGSLHSPVEAAGLTGSQQIYWVVREEKCMWSLPIHLACPPYSPMALSFSASVLINFW